MKIQCHRRHHHLKVPTKTREQNLLQMSVKMQESGQHTDLMQLKDLYLQAIAENAGNHDRIVSGLLLGRCDRPYPGNDSQVFYESISNTYNIQNTQDFELLETITVANRRLGVRLMKYLTPIEDLTRHTMS